MLEFLDGTQRYYMLKEVVRLGITGFQQASSFEFLHLLPSTPRSMEYSCYRYLRTADIMAYASMRLWLVAHTKKTTFTLRS